VLGIALPRVAETSVLALKEHLRDSYAHYEVVKLMEIAPEVIAVNVAQTPTDRAGEPVEGTRGAALYVIARQDDAAARSWPARTPSSRARPPDRCRARRCEWFTKHDGEPRRCR